MSILRAPALACLVALAAAPQAMAAADDPHLITVTGQGMAKGVPDEAVLTAGVQTNARMAADALAANARAMTAVLATLKRAGIAEKDIQTSGFSVEPQYPQAINGANNAAPRIIGYQVSNSVTVIVEDLDKTGPTLDALVASGANSIGGVAFTIKDPKPLMNDARTAAVADAIARAQVLAKAAGITLGPITAISENSGMDSPRPMNLVMGMLDSARARTPIAAGEESLSSSVTITWEIH
jgi:hypothetical protein